MFNFLVTLILITAGLLILAVLVQNSKKEGLGNAYFGGDTGAGQLIGVKKTSDFLEQVTWGLVIALFTLTLATSLVSNKPGRSGALSSSPNIDRAKEYNTLPDTTKQNPPMSQTDAPSD